MSGGHPPGGPKEWAELRLDGEIDDAQWAACIAAEGPACAAALHAAQIRRAALAGSARPALPAALREKLLAIPKQRAAVSAVLTPRAEPARPAIPFPTAKVPPAPAPRGSWWRPAVAALLAIGVGMWVLERSGNPQENDAGKRVAQADGQAEAMAGSPASAAPVVAARSAPAPTPLSAAAPASAAAQPAPVVASVFPAEAAKPGSFAGNKPTLTVMPPPEQTTADRAQSGNGVAMRDAMTKTMALPAPSSSAAPGAGTLLGTPAPAPAAPAASSAPVAAEPALAYGARQLDAPAAAAVKPAHRGESVTTQDGVAVGAGAPGGALRSSEAARTEAAPGAVAALPVQATGNDTDQARANLAVAGQLQKSDIGAAPAATAAPEAVDETGAAPAVLSSAPEIMVASKDDERRENAQDKKRMAADASNDDANVDNATQNHIEINPQGQDAAPGSVQAATPALAPAAPTTATAASWAERNDGHLAGHLTVMVVQRADSVATVRVTLLNDSSPAVRILAGAVTLVAQDAQGNAVWHGQARPTSVPAGSSAQWTWTTPLADGMTWTARWAGESATTR